MRAEELHSFLEQEIPGLSHFLGHYISEPSRRYLILKTLTAKLIPSIPQLPKEADQRRAALIKGLIRIARQKEEEKTQEILEQMRKTIYEEIIFQPLTEKFFDPDSIPSRSVILKMRSTQLNRPRRMLLDLVCLEGLGVPLTSQVLETSEIVLEAFVLTLFQQLIGDIRYEDPDEELSYFQSLMKGHPPRPGDTAFGPRILRLMQGLRMDVREWDASLPRKLTSEIHPDFEVSEAKASENSLIESIRRRNEERMQTLDEAPEVVDSVLSHPPKNRNWAIPLLKPAALILSLFFSAGIYETFRVAPSRFVQKDAGASDSISLSSASVLPRAVLNLGNEERHLNPGEFALTLGNTADLSDRLMQVVLHPGCRAVWYGPGQIHLIQGSTKTSSLGTAPLMLSTPHGHIRTEKSIVYLALLDPDQSVLGVENGQAELESDSSSHILKSGEEMRFGPGASTSRIGKLNYDAWTQKKSQTAKKFRGIDSFSASFSNPNQSEAALTKEMLLSDPKRKATHYLEKL